ncbi:hypothetical protein BT67DRAFT_412446 [Trichocladium antarcticum]|uniref:RING-type domain-containing protein n=1 Tax=Trichocladium antarcticum TaxID=1450529 RepID=A0AAN6US92_9PEZI|nr:hypothetical protein BT67DRAFT_412446 [Trichocladium antarcticum]
MTDSPRPAPAVSLETELTCSICTDLLYRPLTLLDCLHTFCGACLKQWFRVQALRADSLPLPLPTTTADGGTTDGGTADAAVFTCPSCRDAVRDTKHDARVATLLDMFLGLYPERARAEEDRREMDARYARGERVMPRLRVRSEEERRADAEERRVVEEVRAVSLREAQEAAVAGAGAGAGRRSRAQSAVLRGVVGARDGGVREGEGRSASRQRAAAAAARRVEHQSSLRNLISADGMDARDVEREVEEFARQIQEEGLLDGLDLDNLDLENNDELSRKITEAYRRRRRSNASAQSHRSDVSGRPRSRTGEVSRPASRQTAHSRAPSASSNDERGRYPPSSSAHLEVQEPSRRRRRTSSGSRSATVPVAATQPDIRVASRSQTDLITRSGTAEAQATRPGITTDTRSASSPTTITASSSLRGLPFSARAAGAFGILTRSQAATPSGSPSGSVRGEQPAGLDVRQESPTLFSFPVPPRPLRPLRPPPPPPPPPPSRRAPPPRYKEPVINCDTCAREAIQYDLHFNCFICHAGEWNICLDCWRRRKGCLHWFGFGGAAWSRWEKQNLTGPPSPPPHMLTANRYLPPTPPDGSSSRTLPTTTPPPTTTADNPLDRLQSGTFCSGCAAWTNTCYWRCDVCNDGEWGFCARCVGRGRACTHPLLALAYHHHHHHSPASPATSTNNFPPLLSVLTPPCAHCHDPIPPSDTHFHCDACPPSREVLVVVGAAPEAAAAAAGGYDLCTACYAALVGDGAVSVENGPAGWRRCPLAGHRMAVVGFAPDARGALRRRVVRDVVGGRRLRLVEEEGAGDGGAGAGQDREGKGRWATWVDGAGRRVKRAFTGDVAGVSAETEVGFPADGGGGMRAVAGWGWVPGAGGDDELMFPKGAEVAEVEDVNGEWFHGFYMGVGGLFPAPYVRLVGR